MIGLFLDKIREQLSHQNAWELQFCNVQFETFPPYTSPEWYVGIDDNGISQTAPEDSNYMREVAQIQIGVWRRQGVTPRDQSGNQLLYYDPYRPDRVTLDQMENKVKSALVGLPQRNELVDAINEIIENNPDEFGYCVTKPLRYMGRSKSEVYVPPAHVGGDDIPTYLGRRLNFTGLDRIQEYDEILR